MFRPIVVCHQLQSKDNLGSIARVMANFGFDEIILSDPQTHDFRGVEKLAVGATQVIDKMSIAANLPEALGSAVYVIGTTSRTTLKRFNALTPEEGMARLAEHACRGRVAIVLGGEKRGLSDAELDVCHDAVCIPTQGPQPSMNISHAAAVLLYLCSRTQAPSEEPKTEGAIGDLIRRIEQKLNEVLTACEFLNPQAPEQILHELSRALVRGHLSRREAEVWLSALEHVRRVTSAAASR